MSAADRSRGVSRSQPAEVTPAPAASGSKSSLADAVLLGSSLKDEDSSGANNSDLDERDDDGDEKEEEAKEEAKEEEDGKKKKKKKKKLKVKAKAKAVTSAVEVRKIIESLKSELNFCSFLLEIEKGR